MVKTFNNLNFPTVKRIQQLTENHCGPAVVVMLASYLGLSTSQDAIVESSGVQKTIKKRGMSIPDLGKGFLRLFPNCRFWFKNMAGINDIYTFLFQYKFPVGVEWQGKFGKFTDEDNGHYSVITFLNKNSNTITLSDPFFNKKKIDRIFPIDEFMNRWWDVNEITNTKTKKTQLIKDTRSLFLITKKNQEFSLDLKLQQFHLE